MSRLLLSHCGHRDVDLTRLPGLVGLLPFDAQRQVRVGGRDPRKERLPGPRDEWEHPQVQLV